MFASLANGSVSPTRVIQGQASLVERTTHELGVDPLHDEIVVPNAFSQAILIFRGGANGEEKPIRIIQGPKTLLGGSTDTDNVAVDPAHNEIYVTQEFSDSVLVFSREGNGDVAPIRILHGPQTNMRHPRRVSVDPVNNLMVVTTTRGLWFFNRTDNGDVAPRFTIAGPKTGTGGEDMTLAKAILYPPSRKVIFGGGARRRPGGSEGGFIGIWSYDDRGDVPPMYILKNTPATKLGRGAGVFDINSQAKQIIVASEDRVLTYSLPEAF